MADSPVTVRIGAAGCPVCQAAQRRLHQKLLAGGLTPVPRAVAAGRFGAKSNVDIGASASSQVTGFVSIPESVVLCSDPSTWPEDVQSMWRAFQSNPSSFATSGFGLILEKQLNQLGCPAAADAVRSVVLIAG